MTPIPDHRDFSTSAGMDPRLRNHMHLNTNRIYICTDVTNGAVHLLLPKTLNFEVFELRLDDPDPASTDAAVFRLLREEMTEHSFDLP
jgi:hypothetical protein